MGTNPVFDLDEEVCVALFVDHSDHAACPVVEVALDMILGTVVDGFELTIAGVAEGQQSLGDLLLDGGGGGRSLKSAS